MGIFDLFSDDAAEEAARKNRELYQQNLETGNRYLDKGLTSSTAAFQPLTALGQHFGKGSDLYMDSLGINGAEGAQRAQGAFQAGPGYDYAVAQALQGVDRSGAARGMSMSGNTLMALQDRGNNLANQEYGNWQSKLGGFVAPQLQATGASSTGLAGLYGQDSINRVNLNTTTTSGMANANQQEAQAKMQSGANLFGGLLGIGKLFAGGF